MSNRIKISSEVVEDFACDEPFETAQHVFLREAFGESALHVVDRSRVLSEPNDRDHVERAIRFPVTTSVEPHAVTLP